MLSVNCRLLFGQMEEEEGGWRLKVVEEVELLKTDSTSTKSQLPTIGNAAVALQLQ